MGKRTINRRRHVLAELRKMKAVLHELVSTTWGQTMTTWEKTDSGEKYPDGNTRYNYHQRPRREDEKAENQTGAWATLYVQAEALERMAAALKYMAQREYHAEKAKARDAAGFSTPQS